MSLAAYKSETNKQVNAIGSFSCSDFVMCVNGDVWTWFHFDWLTANWFQHFYRVVPTLSMHNREKRLWELIRNAMIFKI